MANLAQAKFAKIPCFNVPANQSRIKTFMQVSLYHTHRLRGAQVAKRRASLKDNIVLFVIKWANGLRRKRRRVRDNGATQIEGVQLCNIMKLWGDVEDHLASGFQLEQKIVLV